MRKFLILGVVSLVGLSACAVPRISGPATVDPAQVLLDTPVRTDGTVRGTTRFCDPNRYASILGEDMSVVETIDFTGEIRIINAGDNVDPRQYDADRLNVSVRDDGSIRAVSCG